MNEISKLKQFRTILLKDSNHQTSW